MPSRLRPYFFLLPLGLLLLASWVVYAPGLDGGFLFDDYANLPALGATGPIDHWSTFWRYITDGNADPIGRPIALLSFLLDAHNWPANPLPFKRTNLLLHLLNGALLVLLLRQLSYTRIRINANDEPNLQTQPNNYLRYDVAALIGAAFWLLHPLLVSTTLYIVQREAILPATFTLLGLLCWLRGRDLMHRSHTASGFIWVGLGLAGCTLLATLCKANGILLPALSLVIEYAWLNQRKFAAHNNTTTAAEFSSYRWAMLFLATLPTALIICYLLQQGWIGFVDGISSVRPWTLGQRLLTEPRVLMNYLELLWAPRPFTPGLFNDQVQASTSLWSPSTTLPSLLAVLGLIIGAWLGRRRWPAFAMVILFYFVGQSLESSTLPLELYFEHRNYLPAMLMFWPLALWLCEARASMPAALEGEAAARPSAAEKSRIAKPALAGLILLGLGLMTHARAELWGNTNDQALMWARLNPNSPRAQAYAAEIDMGTGHSAEAIARLTPVLAKYPDQVQLALNLFGAECQAGQITAETLSATHIALRTTRDPGTLLSSWFTRIIESTAAPPCPQLTYGTINSLLDDALINPSLNAVAGREQDLYYLKGSLALKRNDAKTALADFNHALDLQVRISAALDYAALLGASGHPQLGLAHLDHYDAEHDKETMPDFGMPRLHAWVLQHQQYWPREATHLRATLQRDAVRQTSSNR